MRLIKICLVAIVFAISTTGVAFAEDFGAFTADVTKGWTVKPFGGLKYKAIFGPADGANIVFVEEAYSGSLQSYVELSIPNLKKAIPTIQMVSQQTVKSDKGLEAVKIVHTNTQNSMNLRQVQYMLKGNATTYFVITCTALKTAGTKYDAACSKVFDTFTVK